MLACFCYSVFVIFWLKYSSLQQQLDETMKISKATIDILKDQVFGFDTFFVTGQENYEVKLLFL